MNLCSMCRNQERRQSGSNRLRRGQSERGHPDKSRKGAVIVELALVTPFLLVLTLGVCELGQALKADAILAAAARAGALTGSRPGCSNVDVTADTQAVLASNGIAANVATVTVLVNGVSGDVAAATLNDKITVTVSVPTSQVVVVNMFTYLGSKPMLSQSLTMLKQG